MRVHYARVKAWCWPNNTETIPFYLRPVGISATGDGQYRVDCPLYNALQTLLHACVLALDLLEQRRAQARIVFAPPPPGHPISVSPISHDASAPSQ